MNEKDQEKQKLLYLLILTQFKKIREKDKHFYQRLQKVQKILWSQAYFGYENDSRLLVKQLILLLWFNKDQMIQMVKTRKHQELPEEIKLLILLLIIKINRNIN
ncbi:unnamed protein product [Paramecium sonneborni]|uniref:Uncharacterized protein n=1 Tax=Paramecium sonneborni TaxID=65129 RepID=A0A8S1KKZ4_9CILI|nr:unnamed protein product [Paramecium sonneborni]